MQPKVEFFLQRHGFSGINSERYFKRWLRTQCPLHVAVRERDHAAIRQLLIAGADATATDSAGRTPLELASTHNRDGSQTQVLIALMPAPAQKPRIDVRGPGRASPASRPFFSPPPRKAGQDLFYSYEDLTRLSPTKTSRKQALNFKQTMDFTPLALHMCIYIYIYIYACLFAHFSCISSFKQKKHILLQQPMIIVVVILLVS